MTDKQWEKHIHKCKSALEKYKALLQKCEDEYERRYGNNPSDVDDDWWIDTLHMGYGDVDLEKIISSAKHQNK